VLCGRCGHDVQLHGRRGHGQCRHGHTRPLEAAVDAVRAAVAAGLTRDQVSDLVEKAWSSNRTPCKCPRATKPKPPKAPTEAPDA
jgi:hypothetical protein